MKAPPLPSSAATNALSAAPTAAPTVAELAREFAGSLDADVLMPDRHGRTLVIGRRARLVVAFVPRVKHGRQRIGKVARIELHEGRMRALVVKRNILGEIVWSAWVGSAEVEMLERNQYPNTMDATGGLLLTGTERETCGVLA